MLLLLTIKLIAVAPAPTEVETDATADGAVVGVEAGGERFEGNVVIASGGFDRNPALVKTFLRGPMNAPGSPSTNEGDGLTMGMAVGAALGGCLASTVTVRLRL